MSTQSLPAASLRTGNRLPAGRVPLQVYKHLICWALSSICWLICGAQSIFVPALREAPGSGRRGRRAASSARIVGVLALAQHHADRGAGQVEGLTQRVDKIAAIGIGKVSGRVLTWVMYCKRNRRPLTSGVGWGQENPAFRQLFTSRFMPGERRSGFDVVLQVNRRIEPQLRSRVGCRDRGERPKLRFIRSRRACEA